MLVGWLVAFTLFLAVYVVIPNRHVPVWLVWRGAVIAGLLLEVYHILFPFYAAHNLDGQDATSAAGFALMVIAFFYYFGLVLLLGAEINAFFFERSPRRQSENHPQEHGEHEHRGDFCFPPSLPPPRTHHPVRSCRFLTAFDRPLACRHMLH